jgi:hypothetical protein
VDGGAMTATLLTGLALWTLLGLAVALLFGRVAR